MIPHSAWKRRLSIALAALLFLIVGWAFLQARQQLFRMRAERLLTDIKSLEVNRSSWSDAQKLMTRWDQWGGWYGSCNAQKCSYVIRIDHLRLIQPSFVLEDGPHLGTRVLEWT